MFIGRSRKVMKLLHWERGGYLIYYKRLAQGRFHSKIFLKESSGFRSIRWDELVLLMKGISPKVVRRHRSHLENKLEKNSKKDANSNVNSRRKYWLFR
ncbi:MAG: IS66 family insertion sequence element accessory protein TnpB [Phocaeicola sp.]